MNTLKTTLITLAFAVSSVFAQNIHGEYSTDVTLGDTISFGSPYTGISLSGEGWTLTSNLSDGDVNVEEAFYAIDAKVTFVILGRQQVPFGLSTKWHRPSANSFASEPSSQTYSDGVGASTEFVGVGVTGFYGSDQFYSVRASYGVMDHEVGFSINSDEARLLDCSGAYSNESLGSITSYFEYDLSEETSGDFWYRAVVSPSFTKGISALAGYSSVDEETNILYGVGYHYGNSYVRTELSADGDVLVRVSYTF